MALFMPYALTSYGTPGTTYTESFGDCVELFDTFDATMYTHYQTAGSPYLNKAKPYAPSGLSNAQLLDPNTYFYQEVSCNYPGICPDSTDAKSTCTWLRVLIVTSE